MCFWHKQYYSLIVLFIGKKKCPPPPITIPILLKYDYPPSPPPPPPQELPPPDNYKLTPPSLLLHSAPIVAPQHLTASKNSTSLTLSWNPPPFEDTNGLIQHYTILVTEMDTNSSFSPMDSFTTQITINNLHPYYVYRCMVSAYTVGFGPYSQPITVQLNQEGETH